MVPLTASNRALKTPTFQASPASHADDGGLASRYAQLVPATKSKTDLRSSRTQAAESPVYTEQQTDEALARCQHYRTAGIDDKHVMPFQEDWAVNAVSMLPHHERYSIQCDHSSQHSQRDQKYPYLITRFMYTDENGQNKLPQCMPLIA